MEKKKEKVSLTARQKARRGMAIAPICILICYLLIFAMLIGSGESEPGQLVGMIPYMLLIIVISPIYGFGYAFNWRRTLEKTCRRLGISVGVSFFAIIVYCLTKNKNHLIFGFMIAVFIPAWSLGMGWLPGIFYGIRELKAEHRAEMEAGRASGQYVEPKMMKWLFGNPNPDEGEFEDLEDSDWPEAREAASEKPVAEKVAGAAAGAAGAVSGAAGAVADAVKRKKAEHAAGAAASVPHATQRTLRCLVGTFAGASIPVEAGEELVLGRDPASCNLVMEGGDISRVHCRMFFDSAAGSWKVMDQSTNGTYIGTRKLVKGKYETIPVGTILTLGRGGEQFQL